MYKLPVVRRIISVLPSSDDSIGCIPSIDGMRGIAVMFVPFENIFSESTHGYLGVDIFSSFLAL